MPDPGRFQRHSRRCHSHPGRAVRLAAVVVAASAALGGLAACGSGKNVLNAPSNRVAASGSPSPSPSAAPTGDSRPAGSLVGAAAALKPEVSGVATARPQPRAASSDSGAPSTPAGWGSPVLADDFNGGAVNAGVWDVYDSPDAQQFPRSASRAEVRNGELELVGGPDGNGKDISGGMSSKLNMTYGRWEARIRVDRGAGYNATMLLWPLSDRWPVDGEIDVSEINTATPDVGGGHFVHFGANNSWLGGHYQADMTQWHVLAVEWTPDRIAYFVDGRQTFTAYAANTVNGASPVPHGPMHIALQNDVGCVDAMSCRNASTPPQVVMHVDWVRAYRYPG